MSYILDALKKAEAERNLGAIPTLHAQSVFSPSPPRSRSVWRRRRIWAASAGTLAILIALAWLKPWQVTRNDSMAAAAPEQPMRHAEPAAAKSAAPTAPAVAPPAVTPPAKTSPRKPLKPDDKSGLAGKTGTNTATPIRKKPAVAPAPDETVLTLRDLPEPIQREIPQLSIGGYIYSKNQADRSVLINQKLLREGDQVAPDLRLEKMTPSGVIFSYKGYRYHTSY